MSALCTKFGLLDVITKAAKQGRSIEASFVTTFSFNAIFYEEVLLRAFERAGSRLNVLLVDSRQLAESLADPIRRPQRAGRDYLLVPVPMAGAFHPKIMALLSSKRPFLSIGSHNTTDCGYSRNEEVTVAWGVDSNGVPRAIMTECINSALGWACAQPGLDKGLFGDVLKRLLQLCEEAPTDVSSAATLLVSKPDGPSLFDQLAAEISDTVNLVWVVSPYFDSDLRFLREIAERWSPKDIVIGIQPDNAMLLYPDKAPTQSRFVDVSTIPGLLTEPGSESLSFVHGKLLAIATSKDLWLVIGSPNASAPAWLSHTRPNAEAAVILNGKAAALAFDALGLSQLSLAPKLSTEALTQIASRSLSSQAVAAKVDHSPILTITARWVETGWFLRGLDIGHCRAAIFADDSERRLPGAQFLSSDGGVELRLGSDEPDYGVVRIDDDNGPIAFVVLNSTPRVRSALRPHGAGRLLDSLGRIDNYEGFEDLFDLFEQHVLNNEPNASSARPNKQNTKPAAESENGDANMKPFGPRGISLPDTMQSKRERRTFVQDDYVADFISMLIRDLAPPSAPPLEGDDPNIDPEDRGPNDGTVVPPPQTIDPSIVDWPRLVNACRKRIGVLINRLSARLESHDFSPERAAWLAGRTLTVLLLLQKLRLLPPPDGVAHAMGRRVESLVSVIQLRQAFKIAMRAMYGDLRLAASLEENVGYRGTRDRQLLDGVMLWVSREIGADFDAPVPFNEAPEKKMSRLRDRADILIVAMSSAGSSIIDRSKRSLPPIQPWSDALPTGPTWLDRHIELGAGLQGALAKKHYPTLDRPVVPSDVAFWRAEPEFPRVVLDVSGKSAVLAEPGDDGKHGAKLKIQPAFLSAIDVGKLRAGVRT